MTIQAAKKRRATLYAQGPHMNVDILRLDNGQPFSPTRENLDTADYGVRVFNINTRTEWEEWE